MKCVVCSEPAVGSFDGFQLCRIHMAEADNFSRGQYQHREDIMHLVNRQRFARQFPGIIERHEESIRRNAQPVPGVVSIQAQEAPLIQSEKYAHCQGCGRWVPLAERMEESEYTDEQCETCKFCHNNVAERKTYARGFNDGLDAMAKAAKDTAEKSALRKKV